MKVSVIVGSSSDLPYAKEVYDTLESFGIKPEMRVLSAHRTPEELRRYVLEADREGVEVFIACAGKAAHLPGVVASLTTRPVVGLPLPSKHLYGLDALLSIVQMPPGVPVATVGIGESRNAALLAVHILSIKYPQLKEKLLKYREEMKRKVLSSDVKME